MTAHKTIENRIHQAERMESTGILARGIAHDFGNLLTSIQANLMLAMTEMKPADPGFFISPASTRPPTGPPSLSPGSARWAGISPFKSGGSI